MRRTLSRCYILFIKQVPSFVLANGREPKELYPNEHPLFFFCFDQQ